MLKEKEQKMLTATAAAPAGNEFLTAAEVARIARITRRTVYNLIDRGELPGVRFGRSMRVPRRAIDALVKGATVAA